MYVIKYYLIYIFCICVLINCCQTQWEVDEKNNCKTPRDETGSCISLKKCPSLLKIILNKPVSSTNAELLRKSQCGFEGRTPKVCCPSDDNSNNLDPPDVSKHPNVDKINRENCGSVTNDRIIGGNETGLFEFPWMALIAYNTAGKLSFRCGGTLINDRFILTAAHCITNLPSGRKLAGVRLGEHNIETNTDCQTIGNTVECAPSVQDFAIEDVIPHPNYSPQKLSNDIGLLKLKGTPDFSKKNVGSVCLPLASLRFFSRNVGIVAGWGATESGQNSPKLLKVQLPVTSNEECGRIYNRTTPITYKHLCAGGTMGRDSCGGDSGGPLMYIENVRDQPSYVQHGIVSFGPYFCGTEGRPGVYTRVAYYMDWILNNIS